MVLRPREEWLMRLMRLMRASTPGCPGRVCHASVSHLSVRCAKFYTCVRGGSCTGAQRRTLRLYGMCTVRHPGVSRRGRGMQPIWLAAVNKYGSLRQLLTALDPRAASTLTSFDLGWLSPPGSLLCLFVGSLSLVSGCLPAYKRNPGCQQWDSHDHRPTRTRLTSPATNQPSSRHA